MRDYEMDLFGLEPLLKYGDDLYHCGCRKAFKNTNERIAEIYEDFNFKDKKVFSVLASSDQVFSAYYLGAKQVDTFDANWSTYYYFYLRKWYLMFYQKYVISGDSKFLQKSLEMYNAQSYEEREVYEVWQSLLNSYSDISKIFISDDYTWNIPYIQNIKRMIEIIKDKTAHFTELNLFREFRLNKKYDMVILSNILEDVYLNSNLNQLICDNLRRILNKDGVIICSILKDKNNVYLKEREAFKPYFEYSLSLKKRYNNYCEKEMPLYYTYKKK